MQKLFISHSSKDVAIAKAFVDLMYSIGIRAEQITCSSVAATQIPTSENLKEYLKALYDNDELYVVYLLSQNYYASAFCLNEMGATWVKGTDYFYFLLPGFPAEDIRGVIDGNKIGISLGEYNDFVRSQMNKIFEILKKKFHLRTSRNQWEVVRDRFLNSMSEDSYLFNMNNCSSYCIQDLENDGCKIIAKSQRSVTANIDFSKTTSILSSVVVHVHSDKLAAYYARKKSLCFRAYADSTISQITLEMRIEGVETRREIDIRENATDYRIPLQDFCDDIHLWGKVTEIKFLIWKKNVSGAGKITIENLRVD